MRSGHRVVLLSWLLLLSAAGRLAAQTAEQEVLAVVQRLFDGMRAADSAMVRSTFHPQARFVSVSPGDDSVRIAVEPVDGFVRAVAGAEEMWDERLYDTVVHVDGTIASVWTGYSFYLAERFSHCGVDSIELARGASGWVITQLADTRRREGCPSGSGNRPRG